MTFISIAGFLVAATLIQVPPGGSLSAALEEVASARAKDIAFGPQQNLCRRMRFELNLRRCWNRRSLITATSHLSSKGLSQIAMAIHFCHFVAH